MKPTWHDIDTLDDRRELHHLLGKLSPRDRVLFLAECCRRVPQAKGRLPVPVVTHLQTTLDQAYRCDRADQRVTNEVMGDLLMLMNQWGLDAIATAILLTEWVRKPDLRRAASSSSSGPRSASSVRTVCSSGSGRLR